MQAMPTTRLQTVVILGTGGTVAGLSADAAGHVARSSAPVEVVTSHADADGLVVDALLLWAQQRLDASKKRALR